MKKKNKIVIDSGMGFLRWLYLGIILMQIAGVISWPWQIILAPAIVVLLFAIIALAFTGGDYE